MSASHSDQFWRETYTLNGTEAAKLALKILLVGLVVEARHDQSLEGVASDVGIGLRVV
jgi:hypothetical protein